MVLAAIVAALAGCASTAEWTYEKTGTTPAQVDRDLAACRKVATPRGGFAYPALRGPDREVFNECMRRRGYTVSQP